MTVQASFLAGWNYAMQWEDSTLSGTVTIDQGGRTRLGLAEKYHPELAATEFYTCPLAEAVATARSTYLIDYWTPLQCYYMPQDVSNRVFDEGVNAGSKEDGTILQRALCDCGKIVVIDGRIGPATVAAANSLLPAILVEAIQQRRWKACQAILAAHPEWECDRAGWERRALA